MRHRRWEVIPNPQDHVVPMIVQILLRHVSIGEILKLERTCLAGALFYFRPPPLNKGGFWYIGSLHKMGFYAVDIIFIMTIIALTRC